jgi:hypothetical protein
MAVLKEKLRLLNPKYNDPNLLEQAVKDIMDLPLTSNQIPKKSKKQTTDWQSIYEEFAPLIPLRLKTSGNGQSQIFYVSQQNEVQRIEYTDADALVHALVHRADQWAIIREHFETTPSLAEVRGQIGIGPFMVRMLTQHWMYDERTRLEAEPKQISWHDDEYAYKKMSPSLLKSGPTPTWDEFTSRLDFPEVFKAWVWSIFEPKNNLRQVLWLKGAGNDGKSSVQKALESVLGSEYCYAMKPGDEGQQWFQRNVFGKVLVNYADCRNIYLINENSIKQLTGGDTTSIEGKGENSFTGKIYSKLLVTSNYSPKINPELQAHTSRLIKLEVAAQADTRKDSGFEHRLRDEIYAFLYACQESFAKLISTGNERLQLPDELVQKIKIDCASENYLILQDFVQDHLDITGDSKTICKPGELKVRLRDYLTLEKRIGSDQLKYYQSELEAKLNMMGCFQSRLGPEGRQSTLWVGFQLKNKQKETFEHPA